MINVSLESYESMQKHKIAQPQEKLVKFKKSF